MKVSFYKTIKQTTDPEEFYIKDFLECVKRGEWEDEVLKVRTAKSEQAYKNAKLKLPYVTISGIFNKRNESGLTRHSGFIALDIDDISPDEFQEIRTTIEADKHTFSCFTSCGGSGLVVVVKINAKKHRQAFQALESYYYKNYKVILDTSCKDVSRARFVSYDPFLYINPNAEKWEEYLKEKLPTPTQINKSNYIFGESDIKHCLEQIQNNAIDITPTYSAWRNIGFAIADEYGEAGRDYYHVISQNHPDYLAKETDKQFNNCLKAKGHGVTMGSFFHYCKENGINILTEKTKLILTISSQAKKLKSEPSSALNTLEKVHGIADTEAEEIVKKVYQSPNPATPKDEAENIINQLEVFIKSNHTELLFNDITRRLEINQITLDERAFNSIFIEANKALENKISFEILKRLLLSDYIPTFNPIQEYFLELDRLNPEPLEKDYLQDLTDCLPTDTGNPQFIKEVLTRWFVGMVAQAFGGVSSLMLMLIGSTQNTGKTEFFRRLFPNSLKRFYAESKLESGKDDFIMMCEKLLIMNDEYSGKTVLDEKRMKELLSKQIFSIRAPYGVFNEDRKRIAALAATSNEEQVLKDPTGNRRFLPIRITKTINFDLYNSIDKEMLFLQVYRLFKDGYQYELKSDFITTLNDFTTEFEDSSTEAELIQKLFIVPEPNTDFVEELTSTEIIDYIIEKSNHNRLSRRKMGLELARLGYEKKVKKAGGSTKRVYKMKKRENVTGDGSTPPF